MSGFIDVSGWSSAEVKRLGHEDDDHEPVRSKPKYQTPKAVTFTADQVWGLAVAADRINGGYFKEDKWEYIAEGSADMHMTKTANKAMVKSWLRDSNFSAATAADVDMGHTIRQFFNGLLLKELSGKINDFERQALRIAQKDEFTGRDMLDFAVVSCLPAAMLREQGKKELAIAIRSSTQLSGQAGDSVQGDITVINSVYNNDYNKYRITAHLGDSFVDFWYKDAVTGTATIKGKIKTQRVDSTTQLNYVKIIG